MVTFDGPTVGITFGSLNNWGYYVTPLRVAWHKYWIGSFEEIDVHLALGAGVTKHIVSAGPYRLHGYFGIGSHLGFEYLNSDDPISKAYGMIETGVVNVIGPVNVTLGLMISPGYYYPTNFVLGVGFVF